MDKKFSVIIPCFNSVKYIDECLDSVRNQTIGMENLEVILVNDASTDNTLEHLLKFESEYPDSVIVINLEQNMRQGGARNAALQYASGKYIAFIDSDDWIREDTYEKLYKIAEENETDIVQFSLNFIRDNQITDTRKYPYIGFVDGLNDIMKKNICIGNILDIGHSTKIYRNSYVQKIGAKYPEHVIYEEPQFVYPLAINVERAYVTEEVFYYYRKDNNESTLQTVDANREYQHSQVYLNTYLIARQFPVYSICSMEIDYYFISNFLKRSLVIFAGKKLLMDFDYFKNMISIIKKYVPDWKDNEYLKSDGYFNNYVDAIENTNNIDDFKSLEIEFLKKYIDK